MLPDALMTPATAIAAALRERGQSLAVIESSAGGLISASLVAVPGASAYYGGGFVIYHFDHAKKVLEGGPQLREGIRSATEGFAQWLAAGAAAKLGADWAVAETGAAGPANRYGDPAGHSWVAVRGPGDVEQTDHVLTGVDDRAGNMEVFAARALSLLAGALS